MKKFNTRTSAWTGFCLALATVAIPRESRAQVSFTFEQPTYAAGPLVAQDGWLKNTYYGVMNGAVNVSSTAPITGAQSVAYTQTTAGGFSDVGRFGAILAPAIQGTDLSVSYTIEATTGLESPIGGLFLGNGAPGGASPVFARISGGVVEFGSAGAFVPMNSFFFLEGERIKMTYELDFNTGTMNLILENLSFPSGPVAESRPFFAPYGNPTGPNGEYVVDMGIFFRGGNVKVDDINYTLGVGPVDTIFDWASTGSGNWNQTSNWSPNGVPGTIPGRQTVKLGSAINSPQTIYNNSTRNLNSLEFNSANAYVVAGTGSLAFQSDTSGATTVTPTIKVTSGSHQIQSQLSLLDNTAITVSPGASLDLNNQINLDGKTLTTSGTVRINHSTIGGGSVMNLGALAAGPATSFDGDLVSEGALLFSVDANHADSIFVAGDASLSGVLDVQWRAASLPLGTYTLLSTGGTLDATGLSLASDDARAFALAVDGNSLTLTFLGAVPEPSTFGLALACLAGAATSRKRRGRRGRVGLLTGLIILAVTVSTSTASAQTGLISFESPAYSTGNLIGQSDWTLNSYVAPANVNGTLTVSTAAPLVGSQSLLYQQTSTPAGFGAMDVSKANVAFGTADGTAAIDLTASVRMQAGPSSSPAFPANLVGMFLSPGAFGGTSPIGVVVNDTSIQALHTTGFVAAGSYVPNNVVEFQIGVNFDNSDYTLAFRDITAGGPLTSLTGPLANGRFGYFDNPGAFPAEGDSITRTIDIGLFFRGGTARIDNIAVVGDDFVEAKWNAASGDWSTNNNWLPQLVPNAPGTANAQIAVFGNNPASQTVYTNGTQTVNGLRFDSANKYAIAGGGSLALRANTIGGTVNPTIEVVTGSHELQLPVSILNNAAVTAAPGATLDFNNNVALGGSTLTTSGAVNINFGVTGGGLISNVGTLGTAGATPIAANLNSTGTLQIDLGGANKDFFNITGSATLSGSIDVVLEPSFAPTGQYTILTASGGLNTAGLALHPSDIAGFTLMTSGNNLILKVGGTLPGDFDKNGVVNAADLTKWRGDFGANGNSDGDGDGDSDGNDFLVWQRNLGRTSATASTTATPEPCSLALAAVPFAVLATIGRARRSVQFVA